MSRVEEIVECSPAGIILREKNLAEPEYKKMASQVMGICQKQNVPCILHSFIKAAIELKAGAIHLPLPLLRKIKDSEKREFTVIGASCHSVKDAMEAEKLGCTYIVAGHIFATDCKKGVPPRGLSFLQSVSDCVSIPVFAIGGIDSGNIDLIRKTGVKGACVMSGPMHCDDLEQYFAGFEKAGGEDEV